MGNEEIHVGFCGLSVIKSESVSWEGTRSGSARNLQRDFGNQLLSRVVKRTVL